MTLSDHRFWLNLDTDLLQQILDYRFQNYVSSRSQAIRMLVARGLEAERNAGRYTQSVHVLEEGKGG